MHDEFILWQALFITTLILLQLSQGMDSFYIFCDNKDGEF